MSYTNGRSPTSIEVDGILFDLNRITKPEYFRIMKEIGKLGDDDYEQATDFSGELYEKIIVSWPFHQPVTKEGYTNLGMMDSSRVDAAFKEIGEIITKKKSESLLTPPANSNGESSTSSTLEPTSPALPSMNTAVPNSYS